MPDRSTRITALYQREADRLLRTVRARVHHADMALIEDACAHAWAALVRREDVDPDDPRTPAWLAIVATREAWRLANDQTAGGDESEDAPEPTAPVSVEDEAEAREVLDLVGQLTERQQAIIRLAALGVSREDMAETLGWTVRTVDRQLARARARLRKLRG